MIFSSLQKKINILLIAIILILGISCSKESIHSLEFNSENAFEYLKSIADIKNRHSGSEKALQTVKLIEKIITKIGIPIQLIEWEELTPGGKIKFRNISAIIKNSESEGWIVLATHYDTKKLENLDNFQGANDGASGAALLIEISRVLWNNREKIRKNIEIIFLDGEECIFEYSKNDGLHGSKKHAITLKNEKRKINAVIVPDMLADKDLNAFTSADSDKKLTQLFMESVRELGFEAYFQEGEKVMIDDHKPYSDLSFPSILIIDFDYGPNNLYWHSSGDNISNVSEKSLEISGKTLIKFIEKLLND
ncbi:MAG TPA: M28 family peptidase [Victivallales bacterium]|nr:M28 family peptidase [Victivallales bacterium]HPO90205.1 M28 family peptidase [Victivallales bacterium]HRR06045.1 M28 family peptidase [Victivallales bacterium]HRR27726.1 M28 family peptidase [Victivallales bacterium]HRU00245.1 M28 family peptidase [Victivallales bacterium]